MRYCEQCGAENSDATRFCESCGTELSCSSAIRYRMTIRCQTAPEIGREEFASGQDYDGFLRAICNDGAEPKDLHEYTGVRQDVACSSVEVVDAEGKPVFNCSLNPASAKSGFVNFQDDGDFFDETNVNGKVFLYQLVNWQEQTWSCTLELDAPFDLNLFKVRYKKFRDNAGALHKAISCYEYAGSEIVLDWDGGDGSDDSICWTLENGKRTEIDIYDYEDVEDEEDDEDLDDEVEDGDKELDGKDLDPNRGYYMTVDGRNATMYMDNGQIIRRFHMHANVIQATTSGQTVTILTDDGYTTLYSWTGQLIRRTKH